MLGTATTAVSLPRELQGSANSNSSSTLPANPNAVTRPFHWLIRLQGTCTRCRQDGVFAEDVSNPPAAGGGGGGGRRLLRGRSVQEDSCTAPSIDVFTSTLNEELAKLQGNGNIVNIDAIPKNEELQQRTNACGLKSDGSSSSSRFRLTQHHQLVAGNFDGNITGRRNMVRQFAKLYAWYAYQ